MLRTLILTRNQIVRGSVKKLIKNQIVRGLSSECVRRRGHQHRTPRLTEPRYPTLWKDQIYRRYANYPPHIAVALPALSPTMETGTIVSWAKKEGDKLNEGDLLAEIETDKATMGFETPEEGYLAKILYPSGSKDVQIGKIVCIITNNKDDVAAFKDYKAPAGAASAPAASAPAAEAPAPAAPTPAAAPSAPPANLPVHTTVALPALSPTMETGNIASWAKKEGDKLNEGDLLAEIETDKATMGFETPEEGYLAKILVPAGAKNVTVGKLVCIIVSDQADIAAFKDYTDSPAPSPSAQPAAPTPAASAPSPSLSVSSHTGDTGGRVYASPMAKRLAEVRKIRLQAKEAAKAGAPPSVKAPPPPAPVPGASYIDIPVTSMRATIAKRLVESKQSIPHYYLSSEINVEKLMAFRVEMNKQLEKQKIKLSVNDFIIKAVAATTQRVPEVNSAWMGNVIRQYRNVDVSVAVSTDKGLITPIIKDADRKGVIEISKNMKDLATKARENKLQPQDFVGGTICVSNLGMFDLTFFSAIINPPQSAILAVGGVVNRVIADKDGGFKEAPHIIATLSCDHRVIDGALGAAWLKVLKQNLSDPAAICL
ncbi:dihydrolipoyllysine-residue acetyltransferase component of pyruvate dehydrogenase complex, mitochondrial isoform X2 [Chrysoperla carnea]|uniref:dihydrolipoyllysine-residue acetyltransferase component of pyruvate dehydrogenase complex, mitochondrial isoform X2 n=1 Tax=Chrysoperla carnea TaxID=189513 RepID=UPI001D0691B1|nr:dihydrolipoyllysine-residue acetyltransferase component of pyruvate dehydrogenase complex, mitochondrial isoform X2 [Chrysoperla carnea]